MKNKKGVIEKLTHTIKVIHYMSILFIVLGVFGVIACMKAPKSEVIAKANLVIRHEGNERPYADNEGKYKHFLPSKK
jgi:uncharacterized protein with GYD domain